LNTLQHIYRKTFLSIFLLIYGTIWIIGQTKPDYEFKSKLQQKAYQNSKKFIESIKSLPIDNYRGSGIIKIDTIVVDENKKTIRLYLNQYMAEAPIRAELLNQINSWYISYLPKSLRKYETYIFSDSIELKNYIPNYYRQKKEDYDLSKMPQNNKINPKRDNFVEVVKPYKITNGLDCSNIALWGSHGYYYENSLDRWEWQRARLFTTVEDLLPTSFVLPYIIPMLNNSGAYVLTPRERDIQINEVIIDNDSLGKSNILRFPEFMKRSEQNTGYAYSKILTENTNPFKKGTYLYGIAAEKDSVEWIPDFPESGNYQIYISYANIKNGSKIKYRIYYSSGFQDYIVDQSKGFGTWIPLGNQFFKKGIDPSNGKLVLYIDKGQTASADAAKFGGGIGNLSRNGKISGKPRFMEASHYYMQFAGFPDSLVWKPNKKDDDYADDYRSLGEWVNYLKGKPFGPKKDTTAGLGIPIDLSLAFHTDAGILGADSVVGTLGIYSTTKNDGFFADGQSRYASRDLTDIVQSQIVGDISFLYNKKWTRRGMWNKQYSEVYKPNVPSMLLELLSHQNPNEMKLALDPNFRFDISRAIYKGILRFISFQNGYKYVVQPLPVNHFKTELINNHQIKLSWKAVTDPIESSAKAEKYMVYTRIDSSGFDKGKLIDTNELIISNFETNKIYSFKVTAINKGGESFPSEILSVGFSNNTSKPVLVVNGFDRLERPEFVDAGSFVGFMRPLDQGVPYLYNFNTTGDQYDFNPKSPWLSDDSPGFGASYADEENTIYPGNTFDFPYIHGQSILNNGCSFISMSDEAFESSIIKKDDFSMVDIIMGEEKTKHHYGNIITKNYKIFTEEFIHALENLNKNKIPVFISGSYIATDIAGDTLLAKKVGELLGYQRQTEYAVKKGNFYMIEKSEIRFQSFNFVTKFDKFIYPAESPGAIEPFNEKSRVTIRYSENNMSAGVFSDNQNKVFSLGFPFECISNLNDRNEIMLTIIKMLINN